MRGRWLLIGLIASVALNLFLIGTGVGVIALGERMAHRPQAQRPGALVRATRDLPQPERRAMRQMLRQAWLEVRPATEQSRALRLDGWSALAVATPDPAQAKAKLAQSRQLDLANRAKVEERVVDYAMGLSPANRAVFAEGMRRVLAPPTQPAPER